MKNTKLNEDQLVNEMPLQAQPVQATQSEIAQAVPSEPQPVADPFTSAPAVEPVVDPASIEDVATTTPEVTPTDASMPADPFTPPAPGMIPSGWINLEDLAAAVAQATGDVEAAQTAPDATMTSEPVVDNATEAQPAMEQPAPVAQPVAQPANVAVPVGEPTMQYESLSTEEKRIIERYRALKEANENNIDGLINKAPNEAAEECKGDMDEIIDQATSVKIPEAIDKKAFGDHPTDKDLEVGTKRPQGKYRGDKKGTDGDFEKQLAHVKDEDKLDKGLCPDLAGMSVAIHESKEDEEKDEKDRQLELEIEENKEDIPESESIEEDEVEIEEIPESEDAPDSEDIPDSEDTEEVEEDKTSEEEGEEEETESKDIIVNDKELDKVKDGVDMTGVFEDDVTDSDMDALSRIEAFLDDNSPEEVEDLSNALKSASSFLDFLVNKTFDKVDDTSDINEDEVNDILENEGLPVKDDRPDPFTESYNRKLNESADNPTLPYTLIAVHEDGNEEIIKTLDKEAFDEYFLYMENFEGAPSYDDLYDGDIEMDDTEETTLENFNELLKTASEKSWDLFADDYYLTIAELASDKKNGKFTSNNTFDYEAVVDKLASIEDLVDYKLYKKGTEMPGVSHDIVMDLYSDIFMSDAPREEGELPYAESTPSKKTNAEMFKESTSSKPHRLTREQLLEARKRGGSLKEDSIKYPAGSTPISSQIKAAEQEAQIQEKKEKDIIKEYERKIQERRNTVNAFREELKQNRYRNAAAKRESEAPSRDRFNEALKGSVRLSEANKFDSDWDSSDSWCNNRFIDKYEEEQKLSFKDIVDRMNDHYFG